jgi:hypothetical protein
MIEGFKKNEQRRSAEKIATLQIRAAGFPPNSLAFQHADLFLVC